LEEKGSRFFSAYISVCTEITEGGATMNPSIPWVTGWITTLPASLGVVRRWSGALRAQPRELGGNLEGSEFWTAFANVALVVPSAIFAMRAEPATEPAVPVVLAVSHPLKWGLLGLVSTVLTVGRVRSRWIARAPVGGSPALGRNPGGAI
jgi:hypothetical protein